MVLITDNVPSPHTITLRNISLTLAPGTKTLVCGPSGSGKTSLILCLLRMLPITSGHIIIDGIDTSTLLPRSLRKTINVIPQDAFFMPGSLRKNLDPKQSATDNQIKEAGQKVGMWDNIQSSGGLDHEFDVKKWSVGQKQLLALARALLVESKILVLDEAMSSVDHETEKLMQRVIKEEFRKQTVLVVAHWLRFAEWFDRVVVVKEGRVVEEGSFGELVGGEGEFARLYRADGARGNV
jgi:ATP-binding cassette subfamily C (CFTR/MRP) protein 1